MHRNVAGSCGIPGRVAKKNENKYSDSTSWIAKNYILDILLHYFLEANPFVDYIIFESKL